LQAGGRRFDAGTLQLLEERVDDALWRALQPSVLDPSCELLARDVLEMGAVPDSRWEILGLIAEGDLVVCHNIWSGTYGGTIFRGVATTRGRRFSAEHIHIYRVTDNKIAEHWVVRDDLGMMQQLGAVPGSSTSAATRERPLGEDPS